MNSEDRLSLLLHDLRTPLSAMRLTADLIEKDGLTERQAERMRLLVKAIDALSEMTLELAGVDPDQRPGASAEGEGAPASGQPGQPGQDAGLLLRELAGLFQPRAERQGFVLDVTPLASALLLPSGKALLLRRAASVLIDNALKYADPCRLHIHMALEDTGEAGQDLKVRVWDSGPGVAADFASRLFSPRQRGPGSSERAFGQGLGLPGARALLREVQGDLTYWPADGGGAGFEISLPVGSDAVEQRVCSLADAALMAQSSAHLLVIDDNEASRTVFETVLQSFGMSCDMVADVETALTLLEQRSYDGFLTDLNLPDSNGIAFAHALKRLNGVATPPVLLTTAAVESLPESEFAAAGVAGVVRKPLSTQEFYDALEPVRQYREQMGTVMR